jgi:hypothetical protein
MKIPYEVKEKLHEILKKRQCTNKPYPNGSGLQYGDFNETTSDITKYLEEFLREELIKYEARQRIRRAVNSKEFHYHGEFEFAEQAVDSYLCEAEDQATCELGIDYKLCTVWTKSDNGCTDCNKYKKFK